MANIWENIFSILAGNLNSSYYTTLIVLFKDMALLVRVSIKGAKYGIFGSPDCMYMYKSITCSCNRLYLHYMEIITNYTIAACNVLCHKWNKVSKKERCCESYNMGPKKFKKSQNIS